MRIPLSRGLRWDTGEGLAASPFCISTFLSLAMENDQAVPVPEVQHGEWFVVCRRGKNHNNKSPEEMGKKSSG